MYCYCAKCLKRKINVWKGDNLFIHCYLSSNILCKLWSSHMLESDDTKPWMSFGLASILTHWKLELLMDLPWRHILSRETYIWRQNLFNWVQKISCFARIITEIKTTTKTRETIIKKKNYVCGTNIHNSFIIYIEQL